jgi:AGZA family xanthine/uracil permease-like MFS transporter
MCAVTSYVESAAGVAAGGRTGLTAVCGRCFVLAMIFFAPLASMVPPFATAGALIYVALLMMSGMQHLSWSDPTELLPALLTIIMVPAFLFYRQRYSGGLPELRHSQGDRRPI